VNVAFAVLDGGTSITNPGVRAMACISMARIRRFMCWWKFRPAPPARHCGRRNPSSYPAIRKLPQAERVLVPKNPDGRQLRQLLRLRSMGPCRRAAKLAPP
jgi:hypothetical protein